MKTFHILQLAGFGDTLSSIFVPDYPSPISLTYTMVPESVSGSFDGSIDIKELSKII